MMSSHPLFNTSPFTVNQKLYHLPKQPVAVICIDGCEKEYLDVSMQRGKMPNLKRLIQEGIYETARGALPSFTNVNNACIITGQPPKVTGIPGNFFIDPETNQEVMINDAKYMRCDTILAGAADQGRKVAMITAKDKLRGLLSHKLKGICFSAEKADQAKIQTHGIEEVEKYVGPKPEIYSGNASIYVLKAGVILIQKQLADFCYLSLTDYMQHKYPPHAKESLEFHFKLDHEIGKLMDLNTLIGITADHGMNHKNDSNGKPNVIFLETLLQNKFGPDLKVICPITDPYVVHHGALGGYVVVHLYHDNINKKGEMINFIKNIPGITEVYDNETACQKLELPIDRIGDIIVMSDKHIALGRKIEDHDLQHLEGGLRTHGGRFEEKVPFIFSKKLRPNYQKRISEDVRSFEIFDFLLNGVLETIPEGVSA